MQQKADDLKAIGDLISRQSASMSWSESGPDTTMFKDDFLPSAALYPSSRPVTMKSIDEFSKRMAELAQTTLTSFHERVIGTKVFVFGNVAVAAVTCEKGRMSARSTATWR